MCCSVLQSVLRRVAGYGVLRCVAGCVALCCCVLNRAVHVEEPVLDSHLLFDVLNGYIDTTEIVLEIIERW